MGAIAAVPAFRLSRLLCVRSLSEEALQKYFATEEARRSTQISLVASVAGWRGLPQGLAQAGRVAPSVNPVVLDPCHP